MEESRISVTYEVAELKDENAGNNGLCSYINDGNGERIVITINAGRLNASSPELARTILHETFHAYIYGKLFEEKLHTGLCPEPHFKRDFAMYRTKYGDNASRHNDMSDKELTDMEKTLSDYFNHEPYKDTFLNYVGDNTNWYGTNDLFMCLAWGGLKATEAWDQFSSNPENLTKYNQTMGAIVSLLPQENCNH